MNISYPIQTPSQALQQQQKEFEGFWDRLQRDNLVRPKHKGDVFKDLIADSHSSLLQCISEWAKEKTDEFHLGGEFDEGYKKAMDDLLEYLKL